eukprot:CAMPEP_0182514540 /NCGR_PEP_ID=MMETSP1321-20130603/35934_1 /TAXON_ID=91990 /ORGANISM="Bolidomonas sp., Strain RCC1657" /LENGTH=43 /DNA_ID= /DNA_START= /DNA_END= /DNA_ORIENTATION=
MAHSNDNHRLPLSYESNIDSVSSPGPSPGPIINEPSNSASNSA